jgi:putative endonuclease
MNLYKAFIYIMSNKNRTTFYIGMTNNLERRVREHRSGEGSVFTSKYQLNHLVYYEIMQDIRTAFKRERQLKRWHREWKINLIKELNPNLEDLASDWE